ncbi:MAG: hypothetical protein AB8E15_11295 [Bdellovibrionales bacterium]
MIKQIIVLLGLVFFMIGLKADENDCNVKESVSYVFIDFAIEEGGYCVYSISIDTAKSRLADGACDMPFTGVPEIDRTTQIVDAKSGSCSFEKGDEFNALLVRTSSFVVKIKKFYPAGNDE